MTKKQLFDQINDSRRNRGLAPLTWLEFMTKKEPAIKIPPKKERPKGYFNFDPEPEPVKIHRPPAVYDNQSARAKYGL